MFLYLSLSYCETISYVCSVQLTLVVCSVLCYVVTLAEGMDLWNSSETTARVWTELRTCLRDRVKEMGFITVIKLTDALTRLMKSLTRALGSQRVLCTGCWWFGQACCQSLQLLVAQHHMHDIHRQNNPAHFNNLCRFYKHRNNKTC